MVGKGVGKRSSVSMVAGERRLWWRGGMVVHGRRRARCSGSMVKAKRVRDVGLGASSVRRAPVLSLRGS
jgi:hypothetical protein